MDPLEAAAVVLSVAAVALTALRHRLCWPVGFVSVLLYALVFERARLYSDALLQLVYAALECYGWWQWRRLPADAGRPRARAPERREIAAPLALALPGALALGAFMAHGTDAAFPWLDAALTALSLVAQFWMARMIRLNWLLWIGVDAVYVGVYWMRALPLTAGLYALFIALAAYGWWQWRSVPSPACGRGLG